MAHVGLSWALQSLGKDRKGSEKSAVAVSAEYPPKPSSFHHTITWDNY